MYTISKNLKLTAIILMVVGAIGLIYGFINVPSSVEEVHEIMAAQENHGHGNTAHVDHAHDDEHAEHIFHQLQNKPWASIYTAALFFFLLSLGALAFYAIQIAAQAGWSPVLFRVMEGVAAYIFPGGVIVFVLLVLSSLHLNHLFIWMDADVVAHDEIIANKTGYLNVPFFLIRAAIFIGGWAFFYHRFRKNSIKLDEGFDPQLFKKMFKLSAIFLVFFIVTESIMSWDFIMSIDTHWFSTLFGWFVFASLFVSGITTIALVTLYLKSKGHLEEVNDSHIHDLAKFMFGISIFWEYLWFSQFLLIWYANIPEEAVYYVQRIEQYPLLFFGTFFLNFLLPLMILINTEFKRIPWIVSLAGTIILIGHYVNFYVMIMPGTVGESWSFGAAEIGSIFLIGGLFLLVVFTALSKAPLVIKNYPLLKESKHFHY